MHTSNLNQAEEISATVERGLVLMLSQTYPICPNLSPSTTLYTSDSRQKAIILFFSKTIISWPQSHSALITSQYITYSNRTILYQLSISLVLYACLTHSNTSFIPPTRRCIYNQRSFHTYIPHYVYLSLLYDVINVTSIQFILIFHIISYLREKSSLSLGKLVVAKVEPFGWSSQSTSSHSLHISYPTRSLVLLHT